MLRLRWTSCLILTALLMLCGAKFASAASRAAIGAKNSIGCRVDPQHETRLIIDEEGVYDNYLVDGQWNQGNLVKIRANNVILRNSEIRFVRGNGIFVSGEDVVIDSCKIHHCLSGSYLNQDDAHGITGNPKNLTIRNCEIYYVSGDAVQFDPDRSLWDKVKIENCTFWTGPLPERVAEFYAGERPGENAVDTKQLHSNPRSRLTIRNSLFYGWGDGQIEDQSALNIKEHVGVTIENCVFRDNDICFRLRGYRAPADITVTDCAVYDSKIAFRLEDNIRNVVIQRLALGGDVGKVFQLANMKNGNYVNLDETIAPPYEDAIRKGLSTQSIQSEEEPLTESAPAEPNQNVVVEQFNINSYLPGGSLRVALAVFIVVAMPILGFGIYIRFSGRKKVFGKVVEDLIRRMFTR